MAHHGPVESVLSHDAAAAPALLSLAPLGPPVLEPDLVRGREEAEKLEKRHYKNGGGVGGEEKRTPLRDSGSAKGPFRTHKPEGQRSSSPPNPQGLNIMGIT